MANESACTRSRRAAAAVHLVLRALVVVALLAPGSGVIAQDPGAPPVEGRVFTVFPDSGFYPHHVADPLRAQSTLMWSSVTDSEVPESGDPRFILRLGGSFPLCRITPAGAPDRGWQLDFNGGFFGHFDTGYSLDNLGWDGVFGLLLTWKPDDRFAFRAGARHDSAHVGDEYAERTGRTRIGYTRDEWVAGVSWTASEQWQAYAEAGYGLDLDEFQEPLRLQAGVEWQGRRGFWSDRARWYAALDLGAYEEGDWDTRLTTQAGVMIDTGRGSQRYRLAVEYTDGRSVLGEFSQYDETTLGIGWHFDF